MGFVQLSRTQGVAASTMTGRVLGWHWQTRLLTPRDGAALMTALAIQAEAQVGICAVARVERVMMERKERKVFMTIVWRCCVLNSVAM